jgi:hypothetical protein
VGFIKIKKFLFKITISVYCIASQNHEQHAGSLQIVAIFSPALVMFAINFAVSLVEIEYIVIFPFPLE